MRSLFLSRLHLKTSSVLMLIVAISGCAGRSGPGSDAQFRIGYFPNLTHATAIAGFEAGFFQRHASSRLKIVPVPFTAGPAAIEALITNGIDAAFIGSSPAINIFARSKGEAIRIISGAASGGASLVVQPYIRSPSDLRGKRIASPQLGNTQDVALRAWLAARGFKTTLEGGGEVFVVPQENAQTLQEFEDGRIDGAWVPEPWATRLIQEGNGKVLVDETSLWPDGRFTTTHVIVRTDLLKADPGLVKGFLEGIVASTDFLNLETTRAKTLVGSSIGMLTGKSLPEGVIDAAWEKLSFTYDPIASSLRSVADDAVELGLIAPVDLEGIHDLRLLNEVLARAGRPQVKA